MTPILRYAIVFADNAHQNHCGILPLYVHVLLPTLPCTRISIHYGLQRERAYFGHYRDR